MTTLELIRDRQALADFLSKVQYRSPFAFGDPAHKYAEWFRQLWGLKIHYVYVVLIAEEPKFIGWHTFCPYRIIARHFSGKMAGNGGFVVDPKDHRSTTIALIPVDPGTAQIFRTHVIDFLFGNDETPFFEDGLFMTFDAIKEWLHKVEKIALDPFAPVSKVEWAKEVLIKIKPNVYVRNGLASKILFLEEKLWEQLPF